VSRTRVFVSFDRENDADLGALLNAQSRRPGSTFDVMKSQHRKTARPGWDTDTRTQIRAADEFLVICGENTHESILVSLELAIAQEEDKPYMLLWGRRDRMCTKPEGARKLDAMYSWTREILESQISATIRDSKPLVVPENCKRVQPRASPDTAT
jgi:hypothetical protein